MFWREIAQRRIKDRECPYCQADLMQYQPREYCEIYSENGFDKEWQEFVIEVDCTCPECKGCWDYVVSLTPQEIIEKAGKLWVHCEDYPRKHEDATGQQKICL